MARWDVHVTVWPSYLPTSIREGVDDNNKETIVPDQGESGAARALTCSCLAIGRGSRPRSRRLQRRRHLIDSVLEWAGLPDLDVGSIHGAHAGCASRAALLVNLVMSSPLALIL